MKPRSASFTTRNLAEKLQATLFGNPDLLITGLCPLHTPSSGHLTFFKGKSQTAAWRTLIRLPEVAVLIEPSLLPDSESLRSLRCVVLAVPNPHRSFVDSVDYFYEAEPRSAVIHPTAQIDPTALIEEGVSIGAFCVIGERAHIKSGVRLHNSVTVCREVTVGERSELFSYVSIREGSRIGSDCIIHNNSVIGADGFGYIADPSFGIKKVPQVGTVSIGNSVEIGANSTIDRATIGCTTIGDHTKIDNQVQIGHNVSLGRHCLICAQVGIAGSATIGDGVVLGGGTGVADHVTVVSGVRVGGHSGVTTNISEPGDYLGMPAVKAGIHRRQQATVKRLSRRGGSATQE